jgi:hypothetical protein
MDSLVGSLIGVFTVRNGGTCHVRNYVPEGLNYLFEIVKDVPILCYERRTAK